METIELIKKYILNELSDSEKNEFEEKLKNDPQLQEDVLTQKQIMKGVERIAVKKSAGKAFKKYKLFKSLKIWGSGFGLATLATAGILYFNSPTQQKEEIVHALNEVNSKEWADADKLIPSQVFQIDPNQDTVIETDGGIIMAMPKGTWVDNNGNSVEGPIDIEVKEALDNASIMSSGLGTTSDGELLETGGMFYVNGRKDGKNLKIKEGESISTSIPTDDYKDGMQLFDGERKPDGTINWKNPKKIENYLQPVDIFSLNFYPPNYLDSVASLGLDASNKKFTDSLYYSFLVETNIEQPANMEIMTEEEIEEDSVEFYSDTTDLEGTYISVTDYASGSTTLQSEAVPIPENKPVRKNPEGISPQSIKTLWSAKFQRTLIATTAFEERLQVIHHSCNNSLISLYINNLDKRMSTIDSMVASKTSGETKSKFKAFAAQNLGRVKDGGKHAKMLWKYYQNKSKAYRASAKKALEKFNKDNNDANERYANKQIEHSIDESNRKWDNLSQEFYINVCDACKQLGYNCKTPRGSVGYSFNVTTTGWKNVDRFARAVWKSTVNRETLDYTDSLTGKRAVIKYELATFKFQYTNSYDRMFVYLLPDSLNSFMRVKKKGDVYTEKLNELIGYDLVAIAYKGEEVFYKKVDNIEPKNYSGLVLEMISSKDLKRKLNRLGVKSHSYAMAKEVKTQRYFLKDMGRQKKVQEIHKLRNRLRPVVLPCSCQCENKGNEVKVIYSYQDRDSVFTNHYNKESKMTPKVRILFELNNRHPSYTYLEDELCIRGGFSLDMHYQIFDYNQFFLGSNMHSTSKIIVIGSKYYLVHNGSVNEDLVEMQME